jgi:hypothetical protein
VGSDLLGAPQAGLMSEQMKVGKKEEGPVVNDLGPANNRPEDEESGENRTPAVAGLIIAIVLLVVGLWLARELTTASKMQDCLMSGRTNCNVIQPR